MITIKKINPLQRSPEGHFAGLVGLGLSLLAGPVASGQCLYEATFIQGPMCVGGFPASFLPMAMDEQGNAAGRSSCFLAEHATVWTGSGLAIPLPDSGESKPFALTDPDHIVGTDVPAGASLGVASFWEFENLILLGTLPGDEFSKAHGINQNIQIVGESSGGPDGLSAFLYENNNFEKLILPFGPLAIANDINAQGQIVGWMGGGVIQSNAFLWESGIVTDLGIIPGGTSADALAVNKIGHVAGRGLVPFEGSIFGEWHGFFWDGQSMIDIGVLPGRIDSLAYDLNDADQIVGSSFLSGEGNSAFLWQDGQIYKLQDLVVTDLLGSTLRIATSINNAGQILVDIGGVGVLLTPIGSAPGDIDNNCFVNVSDLLLLLAEWGKPNSIADINDDGDVNVTDLLALLGSWG